MTDWNVLRSPSRRCPTLFRQTEEKTVMKVGLFINTQFPEGFNLAERVPITAAAPSW
jgi:hypothetical protein